MGISRLLFGALLIGAAPSFAPAQQAAKSPDVQLVYGKDSLSAVPLRVKTARDGHLLLLMVDGMGYVRVIYPVRPTASDRVAEGDHLLSELGGNRLPAIHGFGQVTIVAHWAPQSLPLRGLVQYGHWAVSDLVRAEFRQDPVGAANALVRRLGPAEGLVSTAIKVPSFGGWSRDVVLAPDRSMQPDLWMERERAEDLKKQYWRLVPQDCRAGTVRSVGTYEPCYLRP
ncbi:MAG: hypothetical protein ABI836_14695 [Gemmatimonadota bacterium]